MCSFCCEKKCKFGFSSFAVFEERMQSYYHVASSTSYHKSCGWVLWDFEVKVGDPEWGRALKHKYFITSSISLKTDVVDGIFSLWRVRRLIAAGRVT